MVTVDFDAIKNDAEKIQKYAGEHNVTILDLLKAALNRLCEVCLKSKKVAYTYNPLPENKREKFGKFIKEHFKSKAEFAREADLDLSVLVALINNRRCGNALTWKRINDVFEKHEIKLPYDLQIKYEVDEKFGGK